MPRRFPQLKALVIVCPGFNGRRTKPEFDEVLVGCGEIFNHKIKWSLAGSYLCLGNKHKVRTSAKFEYSHVTPLYNWPHTNFPHEGFGFF